ncbi:MAG: diguanylate cyclase [Desulfobacterales bacterium]|nr:diguanylate cyclase [Desulfobacterales bacterium]
MISIKQKVFISLIAVFLIYLLLIVTVHSILIYPSFQELEYQEAKKNLNRTVHAIERELHHLNTLCHDWAAWNDMYNFIENRSEEFIENSINLDSLKTSQLNLVYILDATHHMVWGQSYDTETGNPLVIKAFNKTVFEANDSIINYHVKTDQPLSEISTTGIITGEYGILLISSRPILKSNNEGPIRGTLIMGRIFNEHVIQNLKDQTRVDFNIIPISSDRLIPEVNGVLNQIKSESTGDYFKIETNTIYSYTLFKDIYGQSAFLVKTASSREITQRGFITIRYTLISILGIGFFTLIVVMFFLHYTVVNPIVQLINHTKSISEDHDFSLKLSMNRKDEIGALANTFDIMVDKIREQTDSLIDAYFKLNRLTKLDGLTKIANRRAFDETIISEWRRMKRDQKPLTLILCDIDFFKQYNDTYGHLAGDECLRDIAKIISESLHRASDLAARYGGEEFAIILPNTPETGGLHIAERIRNAVSELKIEHKGSKICQWITISLGVSCIIPDNMDINDFIKEADNALYMAKKKGRNCAVLSNL